MASETAPPMGAGDPVVSPVSVLLSGLGVVGVSALWNVTAPESLPGERALAIAAGLIAVGTALWLILPQMRDDAESRLAAGGLWALAAAGAFIASLAVAPSWDSL